MPRPRLAVFAIEQVANGLSSGLVRFGFSFAFVGVDDALAGIFRGFGFAAGGAPVGKARLVGSQFKLFRADGTDFDWKRHFFFMVKETAGSRKAADFRLISAFAFRHFERPREA